jgi:hypothetical protein
VFASDIQIAIFSGSDCCLVFTTSLCKPGVNFTATDTTAFTHAFKAVSQGIGRVPWVESSHYCTVGRPSSICVLHTTGGSAQPPKRSGSCIRASCISSLQMSPRSHKIACGGNIDRDVSFEGISAANKAPLVPALWRRTVFCRSTVRMCLEISEVLLMLLR